MNERLLQYIWQFQYFNRNDLTAVTGEKLVIMNQGIFNRNQGPDFLEGRIRIDDKVWVGSIELHINEQDWLRHKHDGDENYANVILHVLWNDGGLKVMTHLPTLILQDRVPRLLINQYDRWMQNESFISCGSMVERIDNLSWTKWKERLLFERLERKSELMEQWLKINNCHWQETLWWAIARSFGLSINADAFVAIASSVPFKIYQRHCERTDQLEALLFGQAGLLNGEFALNGSTRYERSLQKEYTFLKEKYSIKPVDQRLHFLRMRPGCFPTVRLALLAKFIQQSRLELSGVIEALSLNHVKRILNVTTKGYWDTHYVLGTESRLLPKRVGEQLMNIVLINAIIPFVFLYGQQHNEERLIQKAFEWLEEVSAEKNRVTNKYSELGFQNKNAADSQALLELKSSYCEKKRCLDCSIGASILRGNASGVIEQVVSSDNQR